MMNVWYYIKLYFFVAVLYPAYFAMWYISPYTSSSWDDYYETSSKKLMCLFHIARLLNKNVEDESETLERFNWVVYHDFRSNYFRKCYGRDHKWIIKGGLR